MQFKVELQPTGNHSGRHWYRYDVYFGKDKIVSRSTDPELAAALALRARGLEGTILVVDRATGKPRSYTSTAAARFETAEEKAKGPYFRKWRPRYFGGKQ